MKHYKAFGCETHSWHRLKDKPDKWVNLNTGEFRDDKDFPPENFHNQEVFSNPKITKQYDIEIVINGMVVMRRIIPADEELRKQLYFSLREFGDWWVESESNENTEKEIDDMISKGVKKK